MRFKMIVLALPLLLGACEVKVGKDSASDGNSASVTVSDDGNVSVATAAGSQGVSVSVPGFEAKVKIPGLQLGGDDMDIDGMKLYPGTKLQNVDVNGKDGAGGNVNMRFSSAATPAILSKYYADAARQHDFTDVAVDNDNGASTVKATKPDGDKLTIAMTADPKGGTSGQISVVDSK